MPTTSTYTFAGATSPVVGSNGNPFGSITTALTINAQGIVSAASGNTIVTPVGGTITGFDAGYTFEIRFKSSSAPPSDRRIFTPTNFASGNSAVTIARGSSPAGGGTLVHYNTPNTQLSIPAGFFVYDGAFHTYKFVYNTTTVEYFRDNASIGSGAIGAPSNSFNVNYIFILGTQGGFAADAAPSDLTVEYAYISVGSPVTYTYARPSSDITTQWSPSTGTAHFSLINETTASDANYIYATAASQTDEVGLQAMSIPTAGTSVLVNYRVQGITGGGSVTVSLYSGATLVKTDTTRTANNTSPAYYTMTVTAAEWGAVAVNWSNMRLRFVSA